jgi:hypothetical protein
VLVCARTWNRCAFILLLVYRMHVFRVCALWRKTSTTAARSFNYYYGNNIVCDAKSRGFIRPSRCSVSLGAAAPHHRVRLLFVARRATRVHDHQGRFRFGKPSTQTVLCARGSCTRSLLALCVCKVRIYKCPKIYLSNVIMPLTKIPKFILYTRNIY